jgi:hypothetical protein
MYVRAVRSGNFQHHPPPSSFATGKPASVSVRPHLSRSAVHNDVTSWCRGGMGIPRPADGPWAAVGPLLPPRRAASPSYRRPVPLGGRPARPRLLRHGDVLTEAAGEAGRGRVGRRPPRPAGPARERRRNRPGAGLPRWRVGAGKGGATAPAAIPPTVASRASSPASGPTRRTCRWRPGGTGQPPRLGPVRGDAGRRAPHQAAGGADGRASRTPTRGTTTSGAATPAAATSRTGSPARGSGARTACDDTSGSSSLSTTTAVGGVSSGATEEGRRC